MRTMMRGILAMLAALAFVPMAASAAPVKTGHVEAELVAQTTGAAPGSTIYLALRQKIVPGWHTYWRNPGDAGQATSVNWTLPQGWTAGDIVWPTPERFVSGPLMNYVFSDEVLLPIPVTVPASAKVGDTVTIKGAADWLVCKDVCVPEDALLSLDIPIVAAPKPDPKWGATITETLSAAPKPVGLKATFSQDAQGVKLAIVGAGVKGQDVVHAYFFPYNGAVIEQIKPQQAMRGPEGLTMVLAPGYEFQHNKPPATLDGVIYLSPGHAFEVSATPGAPLPGAAGMGGAVATTDDGKGGGKAISAGSGTAGAGDLGLLAAVAFAFLGGLILNLMPCVFPILSLKAAALVRHVESPARARTEGMAFFVGCVLTFVALAAVLIAAQKAGQAVGWGFQLQSPGVVAVLALIMLAVALNLSGVFEIGLSAQGVGQGLAARSDLIGAFFTGVLAVVVAAPCTAPFMAPAIGWALTQPPLAALSVFAALGVGLALPFCMVSFVPALFKRLPRPGAWMEMLRKVLAFPMYGAAAWLAWVFVLEAGDAALPFLLAAAVVLSLAAFLWGVSQQAVRPWLPRAFAVLALIAAIPLCAIGSGMSPPPAANASTVASAGTGIPTDVWSPDKVASLRAAGKPVFVDFTAAWCVTCQVNERTALATKEVADAFQKTGAVYLKADWTNRNADIAKALQAQGRSGVPLYLLYDAKGTGDPKILPQLLTSGAVVEALNAAAKPA